MRKIATALLARLLALAALVSPAVAQQFPITMPPSTVYGRSAITAGPGQAIPFFFFTSNLLTSLCTTSKAFPVFSNGVWQCSTATNTGATLVGGPLTLGDGVTTETPSLIIDSNTQIGFRVGSSIGHIIQRQASDGSLLIGGGQANIVFNAGNPVSIGSTILSPGELLSVGGLSIFRATSTSTTPGFILTGEAANFFSGSNMSPFTNSQNPTVFIGRTEQLTGTTNTTTGAVLIVNSGIGQSSGGANAQQTTGLNVIAIKDSTSTGDTAAIEGIALTNIGSSVGAAFGGFFKAVTQSSFGSALAIETETTCGSGIFYPYDPTGVANHTCTGFDMSYVGTYAGSTPVDGSVGLQIRSGGGGTAWDVGLAFMSFGGTATRTTSIQDDTNAVNAILFNSGAHTYGLRGDGATYSTAFIKGHGFTVDGSGNLTVLSCTGCGSGGGITSLTTDVVATGPGAAAATIQTAVVTYAKIQNIGALAIMGRSANSSGVGANISATAASDAVFRESGSTIGFGTIATGGIANNAVTLAKLATQGANTVLGNATSGSAVPTALSMPNCAAAATCALQWTAATGFVNNTSITAAVAPLSGLTGFGTGWKTLLATTQTTPTTQLLTSASGTYTTPANVLWIEVLIVGAGGGGGGTGTGGSPTNGGNAGSTCWNTTGAACTTPVFQASGAQGGVAGSTTAGAGGSLGSLGGVVTGSGTPTRSGAGQFGTSSGASISGVADGPSGVGGNSCWAGGGGGGAAGGNYGGGGGGGNTPGGGRPGGGGGGGGSCIYVIIGAPAATYTYAIAAGGTAGAAGTSGSAGGVGAQGAILVTEHYSP